MNDFVAKMEKLNRHAGLEIPSLATNHNLFLRRCTLNGLRRDSSPGWLMPKAFSAKALEE